VRVLWWEKFSQKTIWGWLVLNTLMGNDKGVASAKALGSEKRVAMFSPAVQQGVIIAHPPRELLLSDARKLE
jgi:hypothetical protein